MRKNRNFKDIYIYIGMCFAALELREVEGVGNGRLTCVGAAVHLECIGLSGTVVDDLCA